MKPLNFVTFVTRALDLSWDFFFVEQGFRSAIISKASMDCTTKTNTRAYNFHSLSLSKITRRFCSKMCSKVFKNRFNMLKNVRCPGRLASTVQEILAFGLNTQWYYSLLLAEGLSSAAVRGATRAHKVNSSIPAQSQPNSPFLRWNSFLVSFSIFFFHSCVRSNH